MFYVVPCLLATLLYFSCIVISFVATHFFPSYVYLYFYLQIPSVEFNHYPLNDRPTCMIPPTCTPSIPGTLKLIKKTNAIGPDLDGFSFSKKYNNLKKKKQENNRIRSSHSPLSHGKTMFYHLHRCRNLRLYFA